MRVGGQADGGELGIDASAASPGVLLGLEDDDGGTLTEDEAVTLGVVGPGRLLRLVVAGREGLHRGETGDRHRMHRSLRAAGDDHVSPTGANHVDRVAHALRTGRARADEGVDAGAGAELERDRGRWAVGHEHRDGERVDPARSLLLEGVPLVEQRPHATDAGPDRGAEPLGLDLGFAGVGPGFPGRDKGVLAGGVEAPRLDLGQHLRGVGRDRGGEGHGQLVLGHPVEVHRAGSGASGENGFPRLRGGAAHGRRGAQAGDDDASVGRHGEVLLVR